MNKNVYVQYGCGLSAPTGWTNYDCSPTLRLQKVPIVGRLIKKTEFPRNVKYGDIVKGLPLSPQSCFGIYASHVLEHLALDDFRTALRNTYDLLAPDGVFRLVMPDLRKIATDYLASADVDASHRFMRDALLGLESRPKNLLNKIYHLWGNSYHLWLWDERSCAKELAEIGFTSIRRCEFGDCKDLMFRLVEDANRFDGCLALECTR